MARKPQRVGMPSDEVQIEDVVEEVSVDASELDGVHEQLLTYKGYGYASYPLFFQAKGEC